MIRWPGVVEPGTVINDIFSHLDWMPTLLTAAGEPNVKEKLLQGHRAGDKTFNVYLDGYDQTELLASMPVNVSLIGGRAAMLGAAHYARRLGR